VHNYARDGFMAQGQDGSVNYEPNGHDGPVEDHSARIHQDQVEGEIGNYKPYDTDYYSAAGKLYRVMTPDEQDRLIQTIANGLGSIDSHEDKVLETRQFYLADHDYGERVAKAIGLDMSEITQ